MDISKIYSRTLAYLRVPPEFFVESLAYLPSCTTAYHRGFEFWMKVPETIGCPRVPPRTFAYQHAVFLLMEVAGDTENVTSV